LRTALPRIAAADRAGSAGALSAHQEAGRALADFAGAAAIPDESFWELESEFLIPAALEQQITASNVGGVTVSHFEWVQDLSSYFWSEEEVNGRLDTIMSNAFNALWEDGAADARHAAHRGIHGGMQAHPRSAALQRPVSVRFESAQ
jgi:glutamate dehydrogenase/leucine dehydrogenase